MGHSEIYAGESRFNFESKEEKGEVFLVLTLGLGENSATKSPNIDVTEPY